MFFTFPEDARWNADRQVVEFGVEIGEYRGVVRVPRRVYQRPLPERPTPERCLEAYYLQRTRFERIAERKLRRRQLADDGNVEITGRDLREGSSEASQDEPHRRLEPSADVIFGGGISSRFGLGNSSRTRSPSPRWGRRHRFIGDIHRLRCGSRSASPRGRCYWRNCRGHHRLGLAAQPEAFCQL
jgi:hypothetical protein